MGFPRQGYWRGLPFPLQGIFQIQGLNLNLLPWQSGSLPLSHQRISMNKCISEIQVDFPSIISPHLICSFEAPKELWLCKHQFSSVAQSCPTLCDPMDCSTPGFPVHHQLLEFTQTQVLWVGDAIQTSHPLSSPSSPAFNLSQHQGLFQWVCSSH